MLYALRAAPPHRSGPRADSQKIWCNCLETWYICGQNLKTQGDWAKQNVKGKALVTSKLGGSPDTLNI